MTAFKSKEVVRILQKLGFFIKRQTGSHLILFHPIKRKTLPIPMHAKDIKKGLLRAIIKQAESSMEEFTELK